MDKPTPKSQRWLEDSLTGPSYDPETPKPAFQEGINRGTQTSYRGGNVEDFKDTSKEFKVGLIDIDSAILYYFENVIRPNIVQDNQRIVVPTIYGSPERWKAVQNDGFYRDHDGKLLVPLIMFKRNGIEKNRDLTNKLDANNPHNFAVWEKQYSRRNAYDNFSILNNRNPQKELYGIIVPDYVTITYECIVFTNYVDQMNNIIESINFSSDSYWGDPSRFKFRTRIDNYSTTTELSQGNDRAVKTSFTIISNGYLIPDVINRDLVKTNKFYSKAKVIIGAETVQNLSQNR